MSEFPRFELFYSAIHQGREPFPWQNRLAQLVIEQGWPEEVGVPTGLGKTACIDIAVWSLAMQESNGNRVLPTRMWYVVNRRLLVDTAYTHGEHLALLLAEPERLKDEWPEVKDKHIESVRAVARALKELTPIETKPLHVTRLRGGADLGARAPEPSQPTLLFATVPMFASRWLFRGYGSSTGMRPIDAALAGIDSLVLLDEAHLAERLLDLREPLALCDIGSPEAVLPFERSRPRFVAMTATGSSSHPFLLNGEDYEHPVIRKRLAACKPVELFTTTKQSLSKDLAGKAYELLQDGNRSSCIVFVNTPRRAREVWREIKRLSRSGRVLLVTGRMRDREADAVRAELLDSEMGAPAGRTFKDVNEDLLWVVATQTLEVGADLDFDALVTETAGVRALIQRLGRCNRLGERPDARVAVFHAPDLKQPLYGEEPIKAWDQLQKAKMQGKVQLGPEAIAGVLGVPEDDVGSRYEVLPSLVWEWVKTSCPPRDEAPVDAYFAPDEPNDGRVSVCWRAYRPSMEIRLVPSVRGSETVDVPIGEIREFLNAKATTSIWRLAADRVALEECQVSDLRPGDILVLATTDGGYDDYGWNPDATEEVLDVSLLTSDVFPLAPEAILHLATSDELKRLIKTVEGEDEDVPDEKFNISWIEEFRAALLSATRNPLVVEDEWNAFLDKRGLHIVRPIESVPILTSARLPRFQPALVRADALEQLSFDATSVELSAHLGSVGEIASQVGRALGLNSDLVDALGQAGKWHDLGKADQRFQQWLDPRGDRAILRAKSGQNWFRTEAALRTSGWPRGGRHEALSGQLVQVLIDQGNWTFDKDLVLHLVLSHHGHGRPLVPGVTDLLGEQVALKVNGAVHTVEVNLSTIDWGQPARFRRLCERYGYWGLALLEAIVRQADHVASGAVVA